jgi:hypothetical protein
VANRCVLGCRYTWAPINSKQVATIGKEAKAGFTVMVAHNAACDLLPFQLIVEGSTHQSLSKFLKLQPGFEVRAGGEKKKNSSAANSTYYTTVDGIVDASKKPVLAETPPFFLDKGTGHILCAGNKKHWTNLSTLKLWISQIVFPSHKACCERDGLNPLTAKSIVHIDAYPVHLSDAFRRFMKTQYPQLLLVYVPANCTSVMQVADVVLNRPLKSDYTNRHMLFLVGECGKQMMDAVGEQEVKIKFSAAVSSCAAHSLSWLIASYAKLAITGKMAMQKAFSVDSIGYDQCWDDPEFREKAHERRHELFETATDELGVEHIPVERDTQGLYDPEDDILGEHVVEPEDAMFYE